MASHSGVPFSIAPNGGVIEGELSETVMHWQ